VTKMNRSIFPERLYLVKLLYLYLFFGMAAGLFMCLLIVAMNQPFMFFSMVVVSCVSFFAGANWHKISGLRYFIFSICHHHA
jgi:hypothetical protein